MSIRNALTALALLCAGPALFAATATAQDFTVDSTALPDWEYGNLDWGDYDDDGDLDLLFCGISGPSVNSSEVFRNDAGALTPIGAGLVGARSGWVQWGDYDGDGDLDLVLLGQGSGVFPGWVARIYRNDGDGAFTDINAGLTGVAGSSADWGDYDNDGDLDLVVIGSAESVFGLTTLYRNDGADTFSPVSTTLPGMTAGSVAWGDYDKDGDLDLLLTGEEGDTFKPRTFIYRNDSGGVFTKLGADLPALYAGRAVWGDYDQDGDLDILVDGSDSTGANQFSIIRRNDGAGMFTDIGATLAGSGEGGAVEWGDADADGDLDVLMMASDFSGVTLWYYQSGSTFSDTLTLVPTGCCGDIRWGDYDADGRLDFALTLILQDHSGVYHNNLPAVNTPPAAPDTLGSSVIGSTVELNWNSGNDAETSALGLTYNVRVGTSPGAGDIMPAMADPVTGRRKIADLGNVGADRSWTLYGLAPGVYFWSVQSIDNSFAGSAFAADHSFTIGDACPVVISGDVNVSGSITSADIIALVGYIFKGGDAPLPCIAAGDVNCSGDITSADVIALVNFVFKGGTPPCDVCDLIPATWSCP